MSFFSSKTIWVTGASSGIGEALVKAFSKAGAELIISSRRIQELERVRSECHHPKKIAILPLDLEKNHDAENWVEDAWTRFGKIDILINNAGLGQFGTVMKTNISVERKLFEINFFGAVSITKAILPKMLDHGAGKIVSTISIASKFGQSNLAAYSASKAALLLYFESLKEELIDTPINIQVINPGFINTNVMVNSLDANGLPLNKSSRAQEKGMPTDKFANRFLKAVSGNKYHTYIGRKELMAIPFHFLAPGLFYKLLRKSK